jgi:hypothetical protein
LATSYEIVIFDGLVKSRHSRAGGNPESIKILKRPDSRFHGNDGIARLQTFYEIIKYKKGITSFRKVMPFFSS